MAILPGMRDGAGIRARIIAEGLVTLSRNRGGRAAEGVANCFLSLDG